MRRVIINIGYYDIVFTTELVFLGFDPRCVEDLFDASLQAGMFDGVIDAPIIFQQEAFDAFLEGFQASHDLVVVVVFWSDGHCEEDSYVIRCVCVHLRDIGSSGMFTFGRSHILSSSAELSDSSSSSLSSATSMSFSDGAPALDWWSSDASVSYASAFQSSMLHAVSSCSGPNPWNAVFRKKTSANPRGEWQAPKRPNDSVPLLSDLVSRRC